MSTAELPEELITLVRALAEDYSLRAWFERLGGAGDAARGTELEGMATAMEAAHEDATVVKAVRLLTHPQVYRGARAALEIARETR